VHVDVRRLLCCQKCERYYDVRNTIGRRTRRNYRKDVLVANTLVTILNVYHRELVVSIVLFWSGPVSRLLTNSRTVPRKLKNTKNVREIDIGLEMNVFFGLVWIYPDHEERECGVGPGVKATMMSETL